MTRDDLIEAMARAAYDAEWGLGSYDADRTSPFERETMTIQMTAALSAIEALTVVMPKNITAEMHLAVGDALEMRRYQNVAGHSPAKIRGGTGRAIIAAMIAANPFAQKPEPG